METKKMKIQHYPAYVCVCMFTVKHHEMMERNQMIEAFQGENYLS
jgi:hypothetical protein